MRFLFALGLVACSVSPAVERAPIIGGTSDVGDPAVVLLISYPSNQSTFYTCTASVISPTVLVTAAHCVDAANHPGYVFGAFLGDDASAYSTVAALAPHLVMASSVHAHPAYNPAPPFTADIGVVVLQAPLSVTPIPLARTPLPSSLPGQTARLIGYGQTVYTQFNVAKHEVGTVVQALPGDDTVVVGDSLHHSCVGDSGGPALTSLGGTETLIGVDSYTETTGCVDPAHYRRVDLYLPFLDTYAPPPPPDLATPLDLAATAVPTPDAAAPDLSTTASPKPSGCAATPGTVSVAAPGFLCLLLALLAAAKFSRLARGCP